MAAPDCGANGCEGKFRPKKANEMQRQQEGSAEEDAVVGWCKIATPCYGDPEACRAVLVKRVGEETTRATRIGKGGRAFS
ncbi:hypothetical protein FH972_022819 [Carpinus fangiana]|uniref:Uncharacterized protein n=1 Tax=Carpinus fangiana TaxID=176857 RepID=A0A5N6KTQ8_9ROSI|nr:hypothetical protein FH972_022819 [Carpinus fangiana]